MIGLKDVQRAYERVHQVAVHTPVMTSSTIDRMTGCKVHFKCENFQRVGAFKFRGAYNCVSQLSREERRRGVITHSSGNHAQALALAASMLGVKAVVVMPRTSPKVKVDATRSYGAEVVLCEPTLESRETTTKDLIDRDGYALVHPYNDERIIAGAGTAALELVMERGDLDCVLAPVGGGGLISGTAIATKGLCPDAQVIAVEPQNADDAFRSFRQGTIVPSVNPKTIADGLRTSLGTVTFPIIQQLVDDVVTVTELEIVESMRLLWERMKLVVEPSGAVGLAGLLKISATLKRNRVGIIISGGNVDLTRFFDQYGGVA